MFSSNISLLHFSYLKCCMRRKNTDVTMKFFRSYEFYFEYKFSFSYFLKMHSYKIVFCVRDGIPLKARVLWAQLIYRAREFDELLLGLQKKKSNFARKKKVFKN